MAFRQAADAVRIRPADNLYQAEFVRTTQLVFFQAAEATMICQAAQLCHIDAILLAEESAADTARICSADNLCNAATDDVAFRRKLFKYHHHIPVSFFFLSALHPDKSPPSKPAPAEPPPIFVLLYNLASLILRSTDSLIRQSIFLEPSTASSNGMTYTSHKVLAAITIDRTPFKTYPTNATLPLITILIGTAPNLNELGFSPVPSE